MGSGASADKCITKERYDEIAQEYWKRFADQEGKSIPPEHVAQCMKAVRAANLAAIDFHEFQQPINCCNITALAYGFSIVKPSQPCSVDDVFHKARLPGWFVTHDGMTLAETFNAAVEVAADLGGLFVECYHFDAELVDYAAFKEFLLSDGDTLDDVLILNFSVRIAHQWDHGGGHFALVGLVEEEGAGSEDLQVTLAEVHPMKYGKTWTCSSRHLFEAMVDKDGDAKRARGVIRIGLAGAERRPRFLAAAQKSVCFCDPALPQAESAWLARFAKLPADKFQDVLNMGGVTAAALAFSGLLLRQDHRIVEPDDIMRGLSLQYASTLLKPSTAAELESYINRFATHVAKCPIAARQLPIGADADAMLQALDQATGPAKGSHDRVVVLCVDINVAAGCTLIYVDPKSEAAKLSHFGTHWCVAVRADAAGRTITIADPRSKIMTRLWNVSAESLFASLEAQASETFLAVEMKL